ncbi:MAG: aspartate--tRNA(Asn) ligase [Bacilli bacterium]
MKVNIDKLSLNFNNEVTISGFVDTIRDLQYVQFLVIRDNTGKVQATIEKNDENKELNEIVSTLTNESTVYITGIIYENEKVKLNKMELFPSNIDITSLSDENIPYVFKNPQSADRETRLDYRFLDLRLEKNRTTFQISSFLEHSMREYFVNNDYIGINSPKISGESSEGGSEVFKLDYFGTPACLVQSPQLYKQMAISSGFNRVFEMGTVFRAENSHTSYHSTEIFMIDAEISNINSHVDIMDELENMLKYSLTKVKDKYKDKLKEMFKSEINIENPFLRISFDDAKIILKEKMNYVGENPEDFERKEEDLLCKYAKDKHKTDFVFVDKYPYSVRPFYTKKDGNNKTLSFDLLFKGIEITSGAQREHKYDVLINQISEKGINPKTMTSYTDYFKYGIFPHGGFGFGFNRLIMKLLNFDNIREATFIYRGPTRIRP